MSHLKDKWRDADIAILSLTEDLIGDRKRTFSLMLANIEYGHHLARALRRIHVGGYEERYQQF